MKIWVSAALLLLFALPVRPEVVDSAPGGLTVRTVLSIKAPPADVYNRLIRNVGDWWNPEHTFSRDAHNLSIEEKVPGCFCEKLPNGGGVRHLQVVYLAPGRNVVMTGAMGPLLSLGVTGSMSIQLTPEEGGTKFAMTYSAGGYVPAGLNTWAGPVDGMLAEQFTRLKNYIETGSPNPKK